MAAKLVYLKDLGTPQKSFHAGGKAKTGVRKKRGRQTTVTKGSTHKMKKGVARFTTMEPHASALKIVLNVNGQRQTLQPLDARSETFGQDFRAAFKKSVKKARRENIRVTGRPDFVLAK